MTQQPWTKTKAWILSLEIEKKIALCYTSGVSCPPLDTSEGQDRWLAAAPWLPQK